MLSKSHPIEKRKFLQPYPFEIFYPAGTGPFPVIFITPLLGRISFLEDLFFERRFADFFAAHGLAAVVIHRPIFEFNPARGLEQIQEYIEDSLKRNQAVLECVRTQKKINPASFGTFGISFGAIINTLWASHEKRLQVNVFALGGGNLPEIFMKSRDPLMKSYRDAALAHCRSDAKLLKKSLQQIFRLDPLRVGASIVPENTLMILGRLDCVVPAVHGNELRKALGNPETVFLPLGHYFSLLAVPILKWKVLSFFKKKFGGS